MGTDPKSVVPVLIIQNKTLFLQTTGTFIVMTQQYKNNFTPQCQKPSERNTWKILAPVKSVDLKCMTQAGFLEFLQKHENKKWDLDRSAM